MIVLSKLKSVENFQYFANINYYNAYKFKI